MGIANFAFNFILLIVIWTRVWTYKRTSYATAKGAYEHEMRARKLAVKEEEEFQKQIKESKVPIVYNH